MAQFEEYLPSRESYWRAIILFGRNVASYKFALGQSLLELAKANRTEVRLDELAVPFAQKIADHLKIADKQGTSGSSKFLDACREYCGERMSLEKLREETVKRGFTNVIDAFHIVNKSEIPIRFFVDERKTRTPSIKLTDELLGLAASLQMPSLPLEIEARWRLVETAWGLNVARRLISVDYDEEAGVVFTQDNTARRIDTTSCRDALNGYQKGKCFYCFNDISIAGAATDMTDVDHFFPHVLKQFREIPHLDGVWNLVLACQHCNRGVDGKFALVPEHRFLERLHTRNEFFISSHHPLR